MFLEIWDHIFCYLEFWRVFWPQPISATLDFEEPLTLQLQLNIVSKPWLLTQQDPLNPMRTCSSNLCSGLAHHLSISTQHAPDCPNENLTVPSLCIYDRLLPLSPNSLSNMAHFTQWEPVQAIFALALLINFKTLPNMHLSVPMRTWRPPRSSSATDFCL